MLAPSTGGGGEYDIVDMIDITVASAVIILGEEASISLLLLYSHVLCKKGGIKGVKKGHQGCKKGGIKGLVREITDPTPGLP